MGTRTELLISLGLVLALGGCPRRWSCPAGYTPICQSGSMYGTRCSCEPPRRYIDTQ
jgi:hypothetical protein